MTSASFAQVENEFIWIEAPFPSAHASTIVETAEGALIAAWFGGTDEGNPDVGVWSSRKEPGGEWSAPVELYKEPRQPAWNPVLFRLPSGAIRLWFKIGPSPDRWTGAYIDSADSGKTWGDIVWVPAGMLGPVRNKPIVLSNGNILAGTSVESYRAWASWFEISEDGGETWTRHGPVLFPTMRENMLGTIQPTVLEVSPGVVRALFRTRRMGKIATSISQDGGRTWGLLELTDLDHPGAGIDAVRLEDGRCVLIYNDSPRRRTPLSAAVSHDGGESWEKFLDIEYLGEGERGELSYPNVIQTRDGDVHVVYTWKRRRIKHATIPLSEVPSR